MPCLKTQRLGPFNKYSDGIGAEDSSGAATAD